MKSPSSSPTERAANEVLHGQGIRERAESVWGWETPSGQLRAERRARFLIEHAEITAASYCLEVGCGTGVFTARLARTGARLDAVDVSPDLLEKARLRPGCEHVSFMLGNAESGENLRGPYDAVVGVSVLHHLDCSMALPCLLKVLKPGGRFVFSEPNLRNPQIWLERNVKWLKPLLGVSPDEGAFVRGEITATLEQHGLARVSATPFDWLHPWSPRPLIPAINSLGLILERMPVIREFSGSLLIVARKP